LIVGINPDRATLIPNMETNMEECGMDTIIVLIDGEPVAIPEDAWEASLTVAKDKRTEFLLAQLHRAPRALGAPASLACSPGRNVPPTEKSRAWE
jgi:hypothetical protein